MSACSPQRFLPNNLNVLRAAVIASSSVLPVENKVMALPYARTGTAQVALTGTYTGSEQADYDLQIVDTDVEIPRVSAPTFAGVGSGTIGSISATGTQQTYTVELTDAGTDTTTASVQLEGATIKALVAGAGGNSHRIIVDQSTLVFTASNFSTLVDLSAGQGGQSSPFIGQGFDWDSAVLDANGLIPSTAHRIAFGDDRSAVYLAYKAFVSGAWAYYTVPALTRDVPRGSQIYFVTGGRTVSVTDGGTTETTTTALPDGVETAYDLLNWIRTESSMLVVDGVVANDRSPTGQAARELTLRTDAHAEVSSGTGSSYARGVTDVTVAATAGTQLVTLTCYATNAGDHPLARLGRTRWQGKSSLLGDLGDIIEGVAYSEPSGAFGFTIPVRLPIGYGSPKGRFSETSRTYASPTTQAPICPVSLTLGSGAVDQVITMIYSERPSGDCDCTGMPKARFSPRCLGVPTEGGDAMSYETDTVERVKALRLWFTGIVRDLTAFGVATNSAVQAPALSNSADGYAASIPDTTAAALVYYAQGTESLRTIIDNFEGVAAQIDVIEPASPAGFREDGFVAWDAAVLELQADIDARISSPASPSMLLNIPSDRYDARLGYVLMCAGISSLGGDDADTIVAGDGCWRDWGDSRYWKVIGAQGEYAPLFTNHPYVSSRKGPTGAVFSTHEFGLQLNVKCPEDLQLDDRIEFTISGAGYGATYQVGDEMILPIVAAAPLYLTGGRSGDPTQTWNVNGSVTGPLTPYLFNPDAPAAYTYSGGGVTLGFLLTEGGIPWAKGDRYRFAIEGGHIRWRKDGGAWQETSPLTPIPLASVVIDAGLSATFTAGAAASFVAGDIYKFRALQPWAVSNIKTPNSSVTKWSGSSVTISETLATVEQLDMVAIKHALPAGAVVTLWGGLDIDADDWSESLTYRAGVIWKAIDRAAQYLRIVITSATDGSLQWAWAGQPLTTSLSAEMQLRRGYLINRPGGNLQGGRYAGKTVSGEVLWTQNALTEDDVDGITDMLDHVKENNDEPIMIIPQISRTDEPVLFARIASDDVEFPDRAAYNQDTSIGRRVSASLPLEGVWQ